MKSAAGIMLAVFALMALFSFAGIANDRHGIGDCIASTINGGACPENASLLELVSFHTGAFGAFSLAVIAASFLLALCAAAYLLASEILPFVLSAPLFRLAQEIVPHEFPSSEKTRRALARLEHSPTA